MVAQSFENGALVGASIGQLDEGLEDLIEQGVALEAAGVEVIVNLDLVAGAPEVHQLVDLVDQWRGPPARRFEAEVAALPPVPGV